MASYSVNPVAVNKARSLIDARQYVLRLHLGRRATERRR